jgi:aerobic C4-dicarboxylate transport protein
VWTSEIDRDQVGEVLSGRRPFDETTMLADHDHDHPTGPADEAVEAGAARANAQPSHA